MTSEPITLEPAATEKETVQPRLERHIRPYPHGGAKLRRQIRHHAETSRGGTEMPVTAQPRYTMVVGVDSPEGSWRARLGAAGQASR